MIGTDNGVPKNKVRGRQQHGLATTSRRVRGQRLACEDRNRRCRRSSACLERTLARAQRRKCGRRRPGPQHQGHPKSTPGAIIGALRESI